MLITVDTLRADALDRDDSGEAPLFSLERFGRGGVRFSDAFAPASWTSPSLASLMTALVPLRHGLVEPTEDARLAAGVPTLAGALRAAGWSTSAATGGGWAGHDTGMDSGFEQFHEDFDDAPPAAAIRRWSERRPAERPFFLWLHTYVAHDPYGGKDASKDSTCGDDLAAGRALAARMSDPDPSAAARLRREYVIARLTSPCERRGLESALRPRGMWDVWQRYLPWLNGGWRDDREDVAAVASLRAAYRENLRTRVDCRVRATLEALAGAVRMEDTAVFVVADHGEGFGEHGVLSHGARVTEDLVRVPLIACGPGFPAGTVVREPCGLVDVAPTILDLAGLPLPPDVDGHSLLPMAAGRAGGRPVESLAVPLAAFGTPDERGNRYVAVRSRDTAWLATFDARDGAWTAEAWFDRQADPHEQRPLVSPPRGGADPALSAAVDEARARIERRYGTATVASRGAR